MAVAVPVSLAITLVLLAAIHVFWALGGSWGKATTIPQANGRAVFAPSFFATVLVASGLLLAAVVALVRGRLVRSALSASLAHWAAVALGVAFVLRAVGEFRLVGFFKKVRGTPFARWDTLLFSPFSLFIGVAFLYIATL